MAEAFPKSTFVGIDYHAPSLEAAAKAGADAGVAADRVSFQVSAGANFRGTGFDLITCFDAQLYGERRPASHQAPGSRQAASAALTASPAMNGVSPSWMVLAGPRCA
jgi:hypothetical protein